MRYSKLYLNRVINKKLCDKWCWEELSNNKIIEINMTFSTLLILFDLIRQYCNISSLFD